MNIEIRRATVEFHDAVLIEVDEEAGVLVFNVAGTRHSMRSSGTVWWKTGAVGHLRLSDGRLPFSFHPYPDQRLRRRPTEDDPGLSLWGWQIDDRHFTAKAGIVPGRDGLVVTQDTETLVIDIPREFIDLCEKSKLHPKTVLRGFIADLCQLMNWAYCPREDDYSSNGSDERRMAQLYFERAYGWLTATDDAG
jgi:hypothetical protein